MIKSIIIIVAILCASQLNAQIFSEIQEIDGKWHIELINNVNYKIKKIKVITEAENVRIDTAIIKQSIIDSLNRPNAIVVINEDSLTSPLISNRYGNTFLLNINDSINSVSFNCKYVCGIRSTESVIYLDSATIHAGNYFEDNKNVIFNFYKYYIGRSLPSMGKPNKRENAWAIIKGKISWNGKPICNTKFMIEEAWRIEDGCDTLCTDSEGNFTFACLPLWCNSDKFRYCKIFDTTVQSGSVFFTVEEKNPGINYIDLVQLGVNLDSLKAATKLQITPSPASTQLQVSYSMPTELHYADCNLQISNAQGQTLQSITLDATEGTLQVELNKAIGNGLYFCSLVSKGVVYKTVQFMVQR